MNIEKLKNQLIKEEGLRERPYVDTVGKVTIGVGHNLTDNGLSLEIIHKILENDIQDIVSDLNAHLPWWQSLDDVRQRVLADLCFNMGIHRLLKFTKMNFAFETGDIARAAYELKNSQWYVQVGSRGPKLVNMLLTGLDI